MAISVAAIIALFGALQPVHASGAAPILTTDLDFGGTYDRYLWSGNRVVSSLSSHQDSSTVHYVSLALSPTGTSAAYVLHSSQPWYIPPIKTIWMNGTPLATFDTDQTAPYVAAFHPDGKSLLFWRFVAGDSEQSMWRINLDGSGLTRVAEQGDMWYVHHWSYSPDGQQWIASFSNGWFLCPSSRPCNDWDSDWVQLEAGHNIQRTENVRYSFDGARVVFSGLDTATGLMQIFTARPDGTDVEAVTDNSTSNFYPYFGGDGKIYYIGGPALTEVGRPAVTPLGAEPEFIAARTPSAWYDADDALASRFRPILRFDEGEQWRPLNVDALFAEREVSSWRSLHRLCDPESVPLNCSDIDSATDLRTKPSSSAWIDLRPVNGIWQPPDPQCTPVADLRDCNFGPATSLYYHVTSSGGGVYRYIDYWWLYRVNDFAGSFHEADWEGIVVAPNPTNEEEIDFVSFAQHGYRTTYLRSELTCDAGGANSCSGAVAQRVWVYPAGGTHASYPDACTNNCSQPQPPYAEGDHGGERPWGRNFDDPSSGALVKLPPATRWIDPLVGTWTDWPGMWGSSGDSQAGTIASPGNQRRYFCPHEGNPNDPVACVARRAARHAPRACENWWGGGVAAVACSRSRLARALTRGRVGKRGPVQITVVRRARKSRWARRQRASSSPGVTQAAGRPLRFGDELRVHGSRDGSWQLAVNVLAGGRMHTLRHRLGALGTGTQQTISVSRGRTGRPALHLRTRPRATAKASAQP